jgi:hypothetical protein
MTATNHVTAKLAALLFVIGVVFGVAIAASAHSVPHSHGYTAHGIVADSSFTGHNSWLKPCYFRNQPPYPVGWYREEWHTHYTRLQPGQPWVASGHSYGPISYLGC